jgi:hypothetical protein
MRRFGQTAAASLSTPTLTTTFGKRQPPSNGRTPSDRGAAAALAWECSRLVLILSLGHRWASGRTAPSTSR